MPVMIWQTSEGQWDLVFCSERGIDYSMYRATTFATEAEAVEKVSGSGLRLLAVVRRER